MWEVVFGSLFVLVVVFAVIFVRGRLPASHLEIKKKRPGESDSIVPSAKN